MKNKLRTIQFGLNNFLAIEIFQNLWLLKHLVLKQYRKKIRRVEHFWNCETTETHSFRDKFYSDRESFIQNSASKIDKKLLLNYFCIYDISKYSTNISLFLLVPLVSALFCSTLHYITDIPVFKFVLYWVKVETRRCE